MSAKNGSWSGAGALGMREQAVVPMFKKQYLDFSVFLPGEGRTIRFWAIRHAYVEFDLFRTLHSIELHAHVHLASCNLFTIFKPKGDRK